MVTTKSQSTQPTPNNIRERQWYEEHQQDKRATSGIEATRTQPVTLSSTSRDHIQNVQTAPTTSDFFNTLTPEQQFVVISQVH
jgi:hypothetical protein